MQVSELLSVACAFDPKDPILAMQCMPLLLHIVQDPSNHLFVGEEVSHPIPNIRLVPIPHTSTCPKPLGIFS